MHANSLVWGCLDCLIRPHSCIQPGLGLFRLSRQTTYMHTACSDTGEKIVSSNHMHAYSLVWGCLDCLIRPHTCIQPVLGLIRRLSRKTICMHTAWCDADEKTLVKPHSCIQPGLGLFRLSRQTTHMHTAWSGSGEKTVSPNHTHAYSLLWGC